LFLWFCMKRKTIRTTSFLSLFKKSIKNFEANL